MLEPAGWSGRFAVADFSSQTNNFSVNIPRAPPSSSYVNFGFFSLQIMLFKIVVYECGLRFLFFPSFAKLINVQKRRRPTSEPPPPPPRGRVLRISSDGEVRIGN